MRSHRCSLAFWANSLKIETEVTGRKLFALNRKAGFYKEAVFHGIIDMIEF